MQKIRPRVSEYFKAASATWMIEQLPNLYLIKGTPPVSSSKQEWSVHPLGINFLSDQEKNVRKALCGRQFPSRREALQAVEAVLLLAQSEEEVEE